jgi:dCTP deaminase
MRLLSRNKILERLSLQDDSRIFVDPLLDETQIGEVTLDLRLGTDFLVSLLTRRPSINVAEDIDSNRGINSYFRPSRRELGDKFILYPGQIVLATSLEYVGLPSTIFADIISRSSYNRLGITMNTMIQPGFRGCFPLELFNHGNIPIEVVVGGRIVQVRLFELELDASYHSQGQPRKYYGNVRPVVSRAQNDTDLARLSTLRK